eukprot:TRINITY_DN7365_c0_g1_i2.p1 TRINITY_DN7365_c0_g1~~TRINITY_DN7365_c0_g1_i2.p1  ORF type:complete len:448 (-),score=100.49 TRINITY_DN7365_c0_g1_i2:99-1442(-)
MLTRITIILVLCLALSQAKVRIIGPKNLESILQGQEISFALAYFGTVPYGKSLIGQAFLAKPIDGCSYIEPIRTQNQGAFPFFLVMRRSDDKCDAVTQARWAEHAGARVAIIVDDRPENIESVMLRDDGVGTAISIPTIMIPKSEGEHIINQLTSSPSTSVTMSIKFDIGQSDKVRYDIWLSSSNMNSIRFLQRFNKFHRLLEGKAEAHPHYVTFFCFACEMEGFRNPNPNCLSGGRYCASDPDGKGPGTGANVVMEDLRQLCIYQQNPEKWWQYITGFEGPCLNFINSDCSNSIMAKVGIDKAQIEDCMKQSFEGANPNIDDNKILREERERYLKTGVPFYPSIQINNVLYRGNLEPVEHVFDALCASFTHTPEICVNYYNPPVGPKVDYWIIILVVTVILAIFLYCMIFVYKKIVRREMMRQMDSQVSTMVSQYYAMKSTPKAEA